MHLTWPVVCTTRAALHSGAVVHQQPLARQLQSFKDRLTANHVTCVVSMTYGVNVTSVTCLVSVASVTCVIDVIYYLLIGVKFGLSLYWLYFSLFSFVPPSLSMSTPFPNLSLLFSFSPITPTTLSYLLITIYVFILFSYPISGCLGKQLLPYPGCKIFIFPPLSHSILLPRYDRRWNTGVVYIYILFIHIWEINIVRH